MSASWFRVPPWCMATHDEPAAERARAWVYILGAWHAGDNPSVREVRRVTGFGGGRADVLVREAWAWAGEAGAARPPTEPGRTRVAGHLRGTNGAEAGRPEADTTPALDEERGTNGAEAGHLRGVSRARVSSGEEKEMEKDMGGGDPAPPPASGPTPEQPREEPPDLPTILGADATLLAPLLGAGIASVEALTSQTMKAVRMLDGIGPRRILAIRDALTAHGLDFRPEPTKGRKPTTERPGIRELTDRWCAAYLRSTGAAYVWTPGGQTSDNRAAQQVYDAVGWSDAPTEAAVAAAGGAVRRYLRHCADARRTPTLYDLARGLSRWMQDDRATGPPRPAERLAPAVIADRARVAAIARLLPPSTPAQELDHEPSPRPLALVR